ncbi:MAG: hypothetical protein HY288_11775 [Planctomycetia bacterium]|nr:hypothetical protein [Planctomycetia bacterium]
MIRAVLQFGCLLSFALSIALIGPATASAAPRINSLSLRGLQAGGTTTLVIDGSELLPEPRILLTAPVANQAIKDGATAQRLEVEISLDGQTPSGIYLLRVASASGISDAAAIGVDNLPQLPFAPQLANLGVAMTGGLTGSTVLSTSFAGKQGQQVLVEVESLRLGAKLNPVLHLYDARRVQLSWSQAIPSIAGDTRMKAMLPADGQYAIELHDSLYRGAEPGFFRLKVGDFHYADLAYPLAVQQGTGASFEFAAANFPADARASALWTKADGPPQQFQPAPWPLGVNLLSGSRPPVIVSDHAEILQAAAADKLQEIPAAPVAINGRIMNKGAQDRYRLAVTPGQQLRFDVLARRAGSQLDGVLSIQNEQGNELAGNDDQPGTSDPGLDFKVPDKTSAVVVAIRDLQGRGGPDFIYRISITPGGGPDFSLSLDEERYLVPKDGAALVLVRVKRAGYDGRIKLTFPNLPTSVSITGDEIPAGAAEAFVTLSAPGLSPAQSLTTVLGTSTEGNISLKRAALMPENTVNKCQPWLRDEVAVAVTTPSPLGLAWDLFSADSALALGTALPVKLRVNRASGAAGAVRLTLLTTQLTPRKKIKVNNQDREVDDVERTIRFEAPPMIPADQTDVAAKILVPPDLALFAYDLAIGANLLAADNKSVVASAVTPARRMLATSPISLELASQGPVEARAGVGPTGKVTGKINRVGGFSLAVGVSLAGLPKGIKAPSIVVPGDKSEFEFPIALPYATPEGDLANVKLVATTQTDLKNPNSVIRANEIPLAIKVVPGEKPPAEKPLVVFEDQVEFLANLKEGGGHASLIAEEKYSGLASIKVTPDQRLNLALPGLGVKIRETPGPGEYRFLRFAWKKQGGQTICLQLNHDGMWGPAANNPAKFRYHAGPAGEQYAGSVAIDANLPSGFTVVTRDLFADFGEFTFTGVALSPVDGEYALFDHIYLGKSPDDFELVKP